MAFRKVMLFRTLRSYVEGKSKNNNSEARDDAMFISGFSATKPNLHTQDISHSLGGFLLRRSRDMGICVQGEASGEVTQHAGHCLDVHSVLEGNGSEGVAEVVESDLRDASSFQHPFQHIIDAIRGDGTAVRRGEDVGILQLFRLAFCCFRTSIAWGEMVTAR